MQRAPVLLDRYTEFQNWIIQRLAALHEDRIKDGSMKAPIEPNTTLQIAANVWMLWVAWIRWEMINTRTTELPEARTEGAVIYSLPCHHLTHHSPSSENRSNQAM